MSKIIKEIYIPDNIKIEYNSDKYILISQNGILPIENNDFYHIEIKDRNLKYIPKNIPKKKKAIIGTLFSILKSNIMGLHKKFMIKLVIFGVGYKAYVEDHILVLILGMSHKIWYKIPNDVHVICIHNEIIVDGIDKQKVGQVAAKIRAFHKPDVYKGKGIRYFNEDIRMKEIKKK